MFGGDPIRARGRLILAAFVALGMGWLLAVGLIYHWRSHDLEAHSTELARMQAEAAYRTTFHHRAWVVGNGGVFVKATEQTPPNPYLKANEQTVRTEDGTLLARINPAYMTRMVYEEMEADDVIRGRIVSDRPRNKDNQADAWELRALAAFSAGETECFEKAAYDGEDVFRYAHPMVVVEGCLRCHDDQGYQVGDIRGALSFRMPVERFEAIVEEDRRSQALNYMALGLMGLGVIGGVGSRVIFDDRRKRQLNLAVRDRDAKIQGILRNSPGVTFQCEMAPDGTVSFPFCSEASREVFGLDPEEVTASFEPLYRVIHPADRLRLMARMRRAAKGVHKVRCEFRIQSKAGPTRWILMDAVATPFRKGILFWEGYAIDNTETKHLEFRLEESRRVAEEADKAKSNFLAMMSHEIRTPMNGILGLTDILAQSPLGRDEKQMIHTIQKSADTLLVILNDVLDYARATSGKIQLESKPFSLEETLFSLVTLYAGEARKRSLTLLFQYEASAPRHFIGDANRIRQVVTNLLNNALKFTPSGHVLLKIVETSEGRISIRVEDTGIGLPEDKDGLFDPFVQADSSTSRQYGGSGLGLSISRLLVEAMGGTLTAGNHEGGGAAFEAILQFPRDAYAGHEPEGPVPTHVLEASSFLNTVRHPALRSIVSDFLPANPCHRGKDPDLILVDEAYLHEEGLSHLQQAFPEAGFLFLTGSDRELDLIIGAPVERLVAPFNGDRFYRALARGLRLQCAAGSLSDDEMPCLNLGPANILVCEDNPVNRVVTEQMLERMSIDYVSVENGIGCLEQLSQRSFDAILMDIHMPEMDGVEATERAIGQYGAALPPIIAVTANALPGDRERFLAAGMQEYLPKPVRFEALQSCLQRFLVRP